MIEGTGTEHASFDAAYLMHCTVSDCRKCWNDAHNPLITSVCIVTSYTPSITAPYMQGRAPGQAFLLQVQASASASASRARRSPPGQSFAPQPAVP